MKRSGHRGVFSGLRWCGPLLGCVGLGCGAGGSSEALPAAPGELTAGGGGSSASGAGDGDEVVSPTLDNGVDNPLAGERPAEEAPLPTVGDYAGGFDSFAPGRGPSLDDSFSGRPECRERCQDFPPEPIAELPNPPNPQIFEQPVAGPAPCIVEPQQGSMLPANWTRPRVRFTGGGDQHRITLRAEQEEHDLVVYTRQNPWVMPLEVWNGLRKNVYEQDITITVSSSQGGAPPGESSTSFRIAPVQAGGSIVFWASRSLLPGGNTTELLGFAPGDEAVISTLSPAEVQGTILDDSPVLKRPIPAGAGGDPEALGADRGRVRCVGCHTSTPDGESVTITDHWPWNSKVVNIDPSLAERGAPPAYLTPMGDLLLQMPWQGTTTFSKADWDAGQRRVVSSFEGRPATVSGYDPVASTNWQSAIYGRPTGATDELAWIDLTAPGRVPQEGDPRPDGSGVIQLDQELPRAMANARGVGWDVVARDGDTRSAVTPDWSHDGLSVVYTSTDSTADGHLGPAQAADIYTVPFNDGAGGGARPLPGASAADAYEYYPDYSADDQFVAFNRVAASSVSGGDAVYYLPQSEIYVTRVGEAGGTPIRLAANDPAACSGFSSPGSGNSWAKWSPTVRQSAPGEAYSGRTYYFLTFASTRDAPFTLGSIGQGTTAAPASQLYMATLVVDASGNVETYPGLYLWNQTFITRDGTSVEPLEMSNLTPAWDEFVVPPIEVVIR